MKNFTVNVPLVKFFELEGKLQPGQKVIVIENYPAEFIESYPGKYKRYPRDEDEVEYDVIYYKVKMLTDSLYKKGTIKEVFDTELSIVVEVKPIIPKQPKYVTRKQVEAALQKDYPRIRLWRGKDYFYIGTLLSDKDTELGQRIASLPQNGIYVSKMSQLTIEQWVEKIHSLFKAEEK